MKLVTQVRLCEDSPDGLLSMMRQFSAACNWLSHIAFEEKLFRWLPLQRRAYQEIRQRFGLTSTQAATAIRKVAYAYKVKERRRAVATFRPLGAVPLYKHGYKRDGTVAFYGLRVPFEARPGVALSGRHQAVLCHRKSRFFIYQVVEVDQPPTYEPVEFLGCDLGVVNLLTDSDGVAYSGEAMETKRRTFVHRRRNLQRKGTRSATRKLRTICGVQSRYQRDINHCISKAVVAKAQRHCLGIALEHLKGIRDRITAKRRQRARLSNWGFGQLASFIAYKAALAGVPVALVDPRNTSHGCPRCGHVAKSNRKNQATFACGLCGLAGAADHIAALNIRARARGDGPMVAAPASYKSRHSPLLA